MDLKRRDKNFKYMKNTEEFLKDNYYLDFDDLIFKNKLDIGKIMKKIRLKWKKNNKYSC